MTSKFEKDVYKKFEQNDKKMDVFEKDITEMKEDISTLKEDVATLKKDMAFMKEDMSYMQKTMLSIQETMETMSRSIILIEHKVTTEIPALFDGYAMHQERQEIQQENITSLNVKVEEHDIRISNLEQAVV